MRKFWIDLVHWCEYPNFVSTRKFWTHLVHWHQYTNLRVWGVRTRSPNVLKIFKIFGHWQNSSIHVNAPNVFKIFNTLGYPIVSTRTSDIIIPLHNRWRMNFHKPKRLCKQTIYRLGTTSSAGNEDKGLPGIRGKTDRAENFLLDKDVETIVLVTKSNFSALKQSKY